MNYITPIKVEAFDDILTKLSEGDVLTLFECVLLSLSFLGDGKLFKIKLQ